MKQKVFTKPLVREDIDIEKIAGILGLKYWVDDHGFKCIEIGDADWDNTGNEMTLVLKYKCGPYNSENCGIYPCANCKQIVAFYDDRNKVMTRLVIDERPGGTYLREKVLPWIKLQLDYYKRIACLGNL